MGPDSKALFRVSLRALPRVLDKLVYRTLQTSESSVKNIFLATATVTVGD